MPLFDRIAKLIAPPPGSKSAGLAFTMSNRFLGGGPVYKEWNLEKAIRQGYKEHSWVYSATRYHARALAPIPMFAEVYDPASDTWNRDDNHPVSVLLREPTISTHDTGSDLFELWWIHLFLGGNALGHMAMAQNVPVEIWPMMPHETTPIASREGMWVDHYEYMELGRIRRLPNEEVIHLKFTDPANPLWGMGSLQAAAQIVDTDMHAIKWNRVSLQKRARKDAVFYPAEPLDVEQWKNLREQASEQIEGPDNAGGLLIASAPGKIEPMNWSPREMDFIQSRNMSRTEILAALDIKEVLLTGQGTFRNFEHAIKQQWVDVYIPLLNDVAQALTNELCPFWDVNARQRGLQRSIRINYDTSEVPALQQTFTDKLEQAERLRRIGVPLVEINKRLGLGLELEESQEPPESPPVIETGQSSVTIQRGEKSSLRGAQRSLFQKERDASYAPFEEALQDAIASVFRSEAEHVSRAYERGGLDSALEAITSYKAVYADVLAAAYEEIIPHFMRRAADSLSRTASQRTAALAVNGVRLKALTFTDWAGAIPGEKADLITDATRKRISAIVEAGVEVGATPDDIATTILATYSDMEESRAEMIARTEVHSAAEWAHLEGAKELAEQGAEVLKEWVTVGDERVRDWHADIDGEEVSVNDTFSNGLEYPGDPNGSADEVVNCRCALSYRSE